MSALVTKWHNNVRMVDGVRWKLCGCEIHRDDFDGARKTYLAPPSVRTPRQREAWANRVIMAEARKRLKHAQRLVRELEQ
jgi:hypothetical protein